MVFFVAYCSSCWFQLELHYFDKFHGFFFPDFKAADMS